MTEILAPGPDGRLRCWWGVGSDDLYLRYHDDEWGRPVTDDRRLFEMLVLEGFQAGLSWSTILRKREAFQTAFAGFEPASVAAFGEGEVERLVGDPRIVRHRGKIEAAVANARAALKVVAEEGSLAAYFWPWASDGGPAPGSVGDIPGETAQSRALSRDLKRRGFSFVGPTIVYAFMQAVGLVDDHAAGCIVRRQVEQQRRPVLRGFGSPARR
ncbi:MAG TPA: DNA-3-methyladenine glycosylase I [Acidimicrobiia bacterium]|nr:DNA-3-methyladenine glycosylase I [Acidimicrobiia bacterium]